MHAPDVLPHDHATRSRLRSRTLRLRRREPLCHWHHARSMQPQTRAELLPAPAEEHTAAVYACESRLEDCSAMRCLHRQRELFRHDDRALTEVVTSGQLKNNPPQYCSRQSSAAPMYLTRREILIQLAALAALPALRPARSEERRVGKECRSRRSR